jgi:hypothetical protein
MTTSRQLAGAGLTDWIEKNVGGVLGGLSPATRAAAAGEITATAAPSLNVNLIDVVAGGWRRYKKITDAARGTLAASGSTELLPLATHQITVTSDPDVTVLVDGYRVATLQLSLSIVCDVQPMLVRISAGRLVASSLGGATSHLRWLLRRPKPHRGLCASACPASSRSGEGYGSCRRRVSGCRAAQEKPRRSADSGGVLTPAPAWSAWSLIQWAWVTRRCRRAS